MEHTKNEMAVAEEVEEVEYDDEDYDDSDAEIIDINDEDYVVMDADDFLERAENELNEEEETMEEITRDSFCSFEKHTDSVLCVAFNKSRKGQIITGGQDNRAFLFDMNVPEDVIELLGHEESVCCVDFNRDGEYAASMDMNGVIKIWTTSNGKCVSTFNGPEEPEWIHFYPRGNVLIASGNDYSIWMWLVPSGKPLPLLSGHTDIVTCSSITPSGKLLLTGSLDNTMKIWQFRDKVLLYSCKGEGTNYNWHEGGIECLDILSVNSLCATGARDGSVRLFNAKTHKEDENCSVEAICFNEMYKWVASASMNSVVIIYDYDSSRIRQELKHDGGVIRMKWHPNNHVLITGCLDGCIYIWDGRTGDLLQKLAGHTDLLLDMDVFVDGKSTYITSASDDKTCQVFRIDI